MHAYYAIIVGGRGEDISRRDSEGEREREGVLGLLLEHLPFVRCGLLDWPVHKYNAILKLRKLVWSNWSTFLNNLATSSYSLVFVGWPMGPATRSG